MGDTPIALLDQAQASHDDDPRRAAELLRRIDPAALPAERRPGLAHLLNHVLGEKFGAWSEAQAMFVPLLRTADAKAQPVLWRQAAAAALLAGDTAESTRLGNALADAVAVAADQAREVVALTAAMYCTPMLPWAEACPVLNAALQDLAAPSWRTESPLDAAVAACSNNIASSLLERPPAERQQAALQAALEDMAQLAERFWLRAGNWIHHERAAYLRAQVATVLGAPHQAREHALRALAILDANDSACDERVDRAFIGLEYARACRDLALHEQAQAAQDAADALAAQFNDAGVDAWYARRRTELGAPLA